MGDIQFIFEKPQKPVRTVKKRTRLITSCDACRLKKVKCRRNGHGDDKCESCEASGSVCVFNERNRVRSQRGIASFTVAPAHQSRKVALRPISPILPSVSIIPAPINSHQSTSSSFTLPSFSSRINRKPSISTFTTESLPVRSATPRQLLNHDDEQGCSEIVLDDYALFDPHRQAYPHSRLLPHLVDLFLLYAGGIFAFFDPDETARSAREGTLSPLLANCIAAYSTRFSDQIRHSTDYRHLSGEPYLDAAKAFLSHTTPSRLERLHATIIIAWIENGSGRTNSFYAYSRMASSQAADLRLSSEEYICQETSCEASRARSRQTFWSVVWLDIIASTVNGKCCTLRLDECTTIMPFPEVQYIGSLSRAMLYQTFKGILSMMVTLNVCSNSARPSIPSAHRDIGLRQIQRGITTFKERLPASLAFNPENLSFSAVLRDSFAFYLIHALMNCFLVIAHCPSLFWASQPPKTMTEIPRLDIAWSSATAIVEILILMRGENLEFATGISSSFLPISIARGAFLLAQADPKNVIGDSDMSKEEFELMNQFYLDETTEMLKKLSTYWASMNNVAISEETVELCGIQYPRSVSIPKSLPLYGVQSWPQISSGNILLANYDASQGSNQYDSRSGEQTSVVVFKEVTTADRYPVIRRYGTWRDGTGHSWSIL